MYDTFVCKVIYPVEFKISLPKNLTDEAVEKAIIDYAEWSLNKLPEPKIEYNKEN